MADGRLFDPDPETTFVALDQFGRVVDRIPVHDGRGMRADGAYSWDMAAKWAYVASKRAERELPPPCWWTWPVHDPPTKETP